MKFDNTAKQNERHIYLQQNWKILIKVQLEGMSVEILTIYEKKKIKNHCEISKVEHSIRYSFLVLFQYIHCHASSENHGQYRIYICVLITGLLVFLFSLRMHDLYGMASVHFCVKVLTNPATAYICI